MSDERVDRVMEQLNEALADKGWDIETCHIDADNALCEFLNALGYKEVVERWQSDSKVVRLTARSAPLLTAGFILEAE